MRILFFRAWIGCAIVMALSPLKEVRAATDISLPTNVVADVPPSCTVNIGQNINFGTAAISMGAITSGATSVSISLPQIDSQGFVFVSCSNLTSYQVYAPYSNNVSGSQRRMVNSAANTFVNYNISAVSATGAPVPSTQSGANSSPYSRTGAGYQEAITIYGRVPAQNLTSQASVGAYMDTINFTVSY